MEKCGCAIYSLWQTGHLPGPLRRSLFRKRKIARHAEGRIYQQFSMACDLDMLQVLKHLLLLNPHPLRDLTCSQALLTD